MMPPFDCCRHCTHAGKFGRLASHELGCPDCNVCPHEDCPYPKHELSADCGNHEAWMT